MFESFYGLSANPFRLSADERFRFAHRAYVKAWSYLKYAIEQGEGFVLITGRPGTGKTTLIRDILSELDESKIQAVNLITNQFQSVELLRMVALNFGFDAHDYNKAMLLTSISEYAMEQYAAGRRVIIIVDEAQNLTDNGLEELRLLSNLQVGNQSLLQIFLIGQEELRSLIYGQNRENIRQRIVASCRVEPMDVRQTEGYIEHRLGVVGWHNDPVIDEAIYPLVQHLSQGVPREVNHIVGRLLLYGALEEKHQLTEEDLWVVVKELNREQRMGFELDGDLTAFKQRVAREQSEVESAQAMKADPHQAAERIATETLDVEISNADTAEEVSETVAADAAGDGLPAADEASVSALPVIDSDSAAAEPPAGLQEKHEATASGGFDSADTLLQARVDEDATTFGMGGMYAHTDDREDIDELPSIEMTRRYNPEEHKHSHLLSNVDDLLDEKPAISGGGGGIWRWLFYPSAVAVLLLMIFGPKPDQILAYWAQVWHGFQRTYLSVDGEIAQSKRPTVQSDKPAAAAAPSPETAAAQIPPVVTPSAETAASPAPPAKPKTLQSAPAVSETRPAPTAESATAQNLPAEPKTTPVSPAEPTTAQNTPDEGESSAAVATPSEPVNGLIDYDRNYHLTVDEETGELTAPSRQLFLSALDLLRENQKALLIVTGIAAPAATPLEGMRTALKEANMAAVLFLEAGVEHARISIEGGRPEGVWEHAIKSGDNPQMTNLRSVRFKVIQAPDNS